MHFNEEQECFTQIAELSAVLRMHSCTVKLQVACSPQIHASTPVYVTVTQPYLSASCTTATAETTAVGDDRMREPMRALK